MHGQTQTGETRWLADEDPRMWVLNCAPKYSSCESLVPPNKTDILLHLTRIKKDFSNSAAFTETWLSEAIPDNTLHLSDFQLFRADCIMEVMGKTRGGGLCFYNNESWC